MKRLVFFVLFSIVSTPSFGANIFKELFGDDDGDFQSEIDTVQSDRKRQLKRFTKKVKEITSCMENDLIFFGNVMEIHSNIGKLAKVCALNKKKLKDNDFLDCLEKISLTISLIDKVEYDNFPSSCGNDYEMISSFKSFMNILNKEYQLVLKRYENHSLDRIEILRRIALEEEKESGFDCTISIMNDYSSLLRQINQTLLPQKSKRGEKRSMDTAKFLYSRIVRIHKNCRSERADIYLEKARKQHNRIVLDFIEENRSFSFF